MFLTCCWQRVIINSLTLDWLPIRSEVLQGSSLFILYIDSLHHLVTISTLKVFTDDVTVYRVVSSIYDCQLLQEDLSRLYDWTVAWQVRLNPAKCKAFNISNKHSPPQFTYTIGDGSIS